MKVKNILLKKILDNSRAMGIIKHVVKINLVRNIQESQFTGLQHDTCSHMTAKLGQYANEMTAEHGSRNETDKKSRVDLFGL
jgi:hypothetical protein